MESKEIKVERDKMYAQIKQAEDRLKELRIICKHENIIQANYSWRVGSFSLAEVCDDCGEMIKYL